MVRVLLHDLDGDGGDLDAQWEMLTAVVAIQAPELVVLPEMPFSPWLPATSEVDADAWREAVELHERWMRRLGELRAEVVVTTRPVGRDGDRGNEGVVWLRDSGVVAARRKAYLPDEAGFHEATWYRRGPARFDPVTTPLGTVAVMICTELWFPEHARELGRAGVHLLCVPRATPVSSVERWEAGARVLATIAGAYVLSVNRGGRAGPTAFDGGSTLVDPEGTVLARTTVQQPTAVATLDLAAVDRARTSYPRYVQDGGENR
jgi:N-carbamoylputrescine amidase